MDEQSTPETVETPASVETVSQDVNNQPETVEAVEAPTETVPEGFIPRYRFNEVTKRNKELERELENFKSSTTPEEPEQEDESSLKKEIQELKMDKYLTKFPELNDKREELDEFLDENSNLSLDRAITLFRAENGLMTAQPPRKGLEKVVGGPKTAPSAKYTLEEIEKMAIDEPRKYIKLSTSGAFDDVVKWT